MRNNRGKFPVRNCEITELAKSFERFATTIELQKNTLEEMSLRDALTGIANRRAFDDYYSQALNVASRQRWPLSVLLIDVDYFKQYNDNYGHSQGGRRRDDPILSTKSS